MTSHQEHVDDFILSLLLHSSGEPIKMVVITDHYSLPGQLEHKTRLKHQSLHRCELLAGQQQIQSVDKGGGAEDERQELYNSNGRLCFCRH